MKSSPVRSGFLFVSAHCVSSGFCVKTDALNARVAVCFPWRFLFQSCPINLTRKLFSTSHEEVHRLLKEAFSFILEENDESIWRTVWVWFENWLRKNLGGKETRKLLANIDPNVIKGGKGFMSPALLDSFAKLSEEKGRQEGLQKGELIGQIQAYQHSLGKAATPKGDMEKMSIERLRTLAEGLKKEVETRKDGKRK